MLVSKEGNLITLINVFETTPEQQQALIDQWTCFTEEIKDEPGVIGIALHKSTDGTRMINDAQWKSQADFDTFLRRYGADFAQFSQNASRIDPHILAHEGGTYCCTSPLRKNASGERDYPLISSEPLSTLRSKALSARSSSQKGVAHAIN